MRALAFIGFIVGMMACSDPKTRPETADKFKPILVLVNPPNNGALIPEEPLPADNWQTPVAGGAVNLQFHFIGPLTMGDLSMQAVEPDAKPLTLPLANWVLSPAVEKDYWGLRHVSVLATAQLPSVEQLTELSPAFASLGFVRLRYSMLVSDGSRELPLAGDFIVYRDANVVGAKDNLFGSTIDAPLKEESVGDKKLTISSTPRNLQNEAIKIGWYVSAGKIKNRRAASTEWELPGPGEYTLVFTMRGKNSRNGDIQIRQVKMP